MEIHFDLKEFTKLSDDFLNLAKDKFPRKTKAFMGRAGNRMRATARAAYRSEIKHSKSGNLVKGLSRGRPYIYGAPNSLCASSIRPRMLICSNMDMSFGGICLARSRL